MYPVSLLRYLERFRAAAAAYISLSCLQKRWLGQAVGTLWPSAHALKLSVYYLLKLRRVAGQQKPVVRSTAALPQIFMVCLLRCIPRAPRTTQTGAPRAPHWISRAALTIPGLRNGCAAVNSAPKVAPIAIQHDLWARYPARSLSFGSSACSSHRRPPSVRGPGSGEPRFKVPATRQPACHLLLPGLTPTPVFSPCSKHPASRSTLGFPL